MTFCERGGARERADGLFFCQRQKNKSEQSELCSDVVPVVGLEPTRHRWQRILSPPRLPIPTHRPIRTCYIIPDPPVKIKGILKNKCGLEKARIRIAHSD